MKLEQVEGEVWLLCDRPWIKQERLAARRKRIRIRKTSYRRHLKVAGRKLMRRLGKQLLDDAPHKLPLRGYEY